VRPGVGVFAPGVRLILPRVLSLSEVLSFAPGVRGVRWEASVGGVGVLGVGVLARGRGVRLGVGVCALSPWGRAPDPHLAVFLRVTRTRARRGREEVG